MNEYSELYIPSLVRGSYFNTIINCGANYNYWVELALQYVPKEILWEYRERIVFIGTGAMDACRVATALRKEREIIILSERIFPKRGAKEDDLKVKYFIFCVLHELAHAIKQHRSPLLDKLTEEENDAQEKEADDTALTWIEAHIKEVNNPYLKAITPDEISQAKAESQELMKKAYENLNC
jgi:hypothetical protein